MTKTLQLKLTSPSSEFPYQKGFPAETPLVEFKVGYFLGKVFDDFVIRSQEQQRNLNDRIHFNANLKLHCKLA